MKLRINNSKVLVLGGGVLGYTCAIVLSLYGYEVELVSAKGFNDPSATKDPTLASAYPAASIIPHSVAGRSTVAFAERSDKIFDQLRWEPDSGVRLQKHFELFETEFQEPSHRSILRNYHLISDADNRHGQLPIRQQGIPVGGYVFDCFFCQMPIYGPWLRELAHSTGVETKRAFVSSEYLKNISADIVVNCLGSGAPSVFEDLSLGVFHRGLLLKCKMDCSGHPQSYNYTPDIGVYSYSNGAPADVYFYPRTDHCILGGTRQEVVWDDSSHAFKPLHEIQSGFIEILGVSVPAPIWELNCNLIEQLIGKVPEEPSEVLAGIRFQGGTTDDPSLVVKSDKFINDRAKRIDCFGFGGAGVTLSWGAALEVLSLATENSSSTSTSWLLQRLSDFSTRL